MEILNKYTQSAKTEGDKFIRGEITFEQYQQREFEFAEIAQREISATPPSKEVNDFHAKVVWQDGFEAGKALYSPICAKEVEWEKLKEEIATLTAGSHWQEKWTPASSEQWSWWKKHAPSIRTLYQGLSQQILAKVRQAMEGRE